MEYEEKKLVRKEVRNDGREQSRKTVGDDKLLNVASIAANSITLAMLASIISPTHIVKFAGTVTWSGGGATLASTVTGVLSTDFVMVTIRVKPTQAAYLVRAVPSADTITFELSASNTSNDAQISYTVFRATS